VRYSMTCAQYSDVLSRAQLLTQKQPKLGFIAPGWSYCYENSTVVITNWVTVTIYSDLKWQICSFLYHWHHFYRTWLYMNNMACLPYKKQELFILSGHLCSPTVPVFLVGSVLLIFFAFSVVLFVCFVSSFIYLFIFLLFVFCLRPVSSVSNVASVSGLAILDCSLRCYLMFGGFFKLFSQPINLNGAISKNERV
jgi:hypothetical protein